MKYRYQKLYLARGMVMKPGKHQRSQGVNKDAKIYVGRSKIVHNL